MYQRGELARRCGVGIETLRYYEQRRLLAPPERSASGYRLYDEQAVARVRFIKRAQELGFTLKEIRELLELRVDPDAGCAEVRARAEAKIADIDQRIRTLRTMRKALARLKAQCTGTGPTSECPLLEALEDDR